MSLLTLLGHLLHHFCDTSGSVAPSSDIPQGQCRIASLLFTAVMMYRTQISPTRPPCCRYTPTCSAYAAQALHHHGALRGSWLTLRRLHRCRPGHGGHDPVPPGNDPTNPSRGHRNFLDKKSVCSSFAGASYQMYAAHTGQRLAQENTMTHHAKTRARTTGQRLFAGAVGAITAAGLLTAAPTAQAAPPCSQWAFTGGYSLRSDNGWQTFFSSTGPTTVGGRSVSVNDDNVSKDKGNVSGGIQGRTIDFLINSDVGGSAHYTGTIGDDGTVNNGAIQGTSNSWHSINGPLKCNDPAPAPKAPAPETDAVNANPLPGVLNPPPPAAPPKPLQGPTVTAKPGVTGVTFHVTDRSGVASRCTYSSEGYTDSFALPANGSFDLFVPAIRKFRNRTGTITCDNGTSTPTSVNF